MEYSRFLITTTESIKGYHITRNQDLVFANVVVGANIFSEILASVTDIIGGRSSTFQHKLDNLYAHAKNDLIEKASALGANAIVGFRINVSELSAKGTSMFMLSAYGTAVSITKNEEDHARYEQFERLLQMKKYHDAGIVTSEEYQYEIENIKRSFTNRVNEELEEIHANEQHEKEMAELLQQAEKERERREAYEKERQEKLAAELEAFNKSINGSIKRLKNAIKELLEAQQIQLKRCMPITVTPQHSDHSNTLALLDSIVVQEGVNNFDIICILLMQGNFPQACAYYLKSTSSSDYDAAVEYVTGVKNLYESFSEENLIDRISCFALTGCSVEDKSAARSNLEMFLEGNDSAIEYLVSVL